MNTLVFTWRNKKNNFGVEKKCLIWHNDMGYEEKTRQIYNMVNSIFSFSLHISAIQVLSLLMLTFNGLQ